MIIRVAPCVLAAIACADKPVCGDGYGRSAAGDCVALLADDDTGRPPATDTPQADTQSEDSDSPDTEPATEWMVPPSNCVAPADLPADPITVLSTTTYPSDSPFWELLDIEVEWDQGLAWAAGQGGVVSLDVSDPHAIAPISFYSPHPSGRYYRVQPFPTGDPGDHLLYLTHRDTGLDVVDVSDTSDIQLVAQVDRDGLEGMAQNGDWMYIVVHDGTLLTLDISNREAPIARESSTGLSHPWDIVVHGDVAYVADNTLGVVVVDLTNPGEPLIMVHVDLDASVQDIAVTDDALYAALGADGIAALDISDPLDPLPAATVDYGSSVISVSASQGVLWATNHESVLALDLRDPLVPQPVASRVTEMFAMHVVADTGKALIADWGNVVAVEVDPDMEAPDVDLSTSDLYLSTEPDVFEIGLDNRGSSTAEITGVTVDDAGLSVEIDGLEIPPGQRGRLRVTWSGGDANATLCVASNDPDAPVQTVGLHTGSGGTGELVGDPAPDFVLEDLDGVSHRLSEQLGHPVLLAYFATW